MERNIKNKKGFTLIEAIIAIFLLNVGIIACAILADQVFRASEVSKNRMIAANLAQEGIEVVKNIRDNNWLAPNDWNSNIPVGDWEISYNSLSLANIYSTGNYLKIDSNGFYNYSSPGTETTFKRKMTISYPGEAETKIEATIYWVTRGTSKSITITESIYDWK